MKLNETLLWFSVITLALMAYLFDVKYSIILIFWVGIIISVGNAKRFFSEKYFIVSIIFRRSIYIIPFFLPLIIDSNPTIIVNNLLWWCLLGCTIGILLILPKMNEWRLVLSKDMIEITVRKEKIEYYTQIMILIGAAIGEEIFFRNFIIGYVDNTPYILSILLSCGLFFLNHFGVKWNSSFSLYDYTIQIIFGLVSSILFISSKSILPSIIVHIIYNSPLVLLSIKSYVFHYIYEAKVRSGNSE